MSIYGHFPPADFVLEDLDVEMKGQDHFGGVEQASLKISGRICQVLIQYHRHRSNRFDHVRDMNGHWDSELLDLDGNSLGDVNLDRIPDTETIFALLLAVASDPEENWHEWDMLLVTPMLGRDNVFERIGIASIYKDGLQDDLSRPLEFERRSFILI